MKRMLMICVILMLIVYSLGWGNPLPPCAVSEFSTNPVWIELKIYEHMLDLNGMTIHTLEGDAVLTSIDTSLDYIVIDNVNAPGLALNPVGDIIEIQEAYIYFQYGSMGNGGVAPLANESAASGYPGEWWFPLNFCGTPTPGEGNDVPGVNWGSSRVIINEISARGTWRSNCGFIELYNTADSAIDISGYQIICNSRYIISNYTILRPHAFYVLDQERYPADFGICDSLETVYLLTRSGGLTDQTGWSSDHGSDVSFMRYPDGNVRWGYNFWQDFMGYNDESSVTFEDGFPTRRAFNRYEDPGLKIIGIDADTSNGLVNLQWTDPLWLSVFDATIVRKSTEGFPATQYDGDLIYEGTDQAFWGDTAAPGQTTYYSIFARTGCGQYSTPDSESQISVFMPLSGINDDPMLPGKTGYLTSYPNPFNGSTVLSYKLQQPANVKINIYNLIGQKVAILSEGTQEAGEHSIAWNANGNPSGIYFARLNNGGQNCSAKLLLMK